MPSLRSWGIAGLVVFGFALLFFGVWLIGWIPATAQYCEYNSYTEHEKCVSYQMPLVAIRYVGWFLDAISPALTALATVAIGAFTFTLYRATDRLWQAGERQIKVAGDAANAAEKAASAAQRSAEVAEDTLTKVQRPYLFIYDVIGIRPGITEHIDGHIPYAVANLGHTPAIIERVEARISKGAEPEEPGPETDDHPLIISPFLAAQQKIENIPVNAIFWLRGKLSLLDIRDSEAPRYVSANIERGENLFVWLRIGYRGVTTTGHETSGCWRYDPEPCLFIRYGGDECNYTR